MEDRAAQIRDALAAGPVASESLRARLQISRATLGRAIAQMAGDLKIRELHMNEATGYHFGVPAKA